MRTKRLNLQPSPIKSATNKKDELLERMKTKRLNLQASAIENSKTDTNNDQTTPLGQMQSLLKRRKRNADDLTLDDNLPSSIPTSDDHQTQSTVHKENVADKAEQRKEFQENRGIGDMCKAQRMQKRSLEKEASEAEATRGAKRQRLMQKTSQKRASNAASTQESADVDRSASKKDSLFTDTIVDPQDDKRRRRTRNVSSQLQDYITYLGRQINARWFLQAEEFGGGATVFFTRSMEV
jgi:hypothetical protein